ncbi:hypothetical protein ACQW5G_04320 [Fructilactobacillus sp. Tb1]|uniref:hypothetical protein n=1 Tax=Fructilactobacillus sp. Tb1 TaxID=3422304 RepID=UPI003D29319F
MKINKSKLITSLLIIIMGIGLYFVFNGISYNSNPIRTSKTANNETDKHGHSLKQVKHNNQKFMTKSIEQQDHILVKTRSIKVSKPETAKKTKIIDAMETNLDKNIIAQISNLQGQSQLATKCNDLIQRIQNLKSLSPNDKVQFIQEVKSVNQAAKMNQD